MVGKTFPVKNISHLAKISQNFVTFYRLLFYRQGKPILYVVVSKILKKILSEIISSNVFDLLLEFDFMYRFFKCIFILWENLFSGSPRWLVGLLLLSYKQLLSLFNLNYCSRRRCYFRFICKNIYCVWKNGLPCLNRILRSSSTNFYCNKKNFYSWDNIFPLLTLKQNIKPCSNIVMLCDIIMIIWRHRGTLQTKARECLGSFL